MRHRPTLWLSSSPSPSSPWWRSRFSFGNETLSQSCLERVDNLWPSLALERAPQPPVNGRGGQLNWRRYQQGASSFRDLGSPPPRALPRSRPPARRLLRPAAPTRGAAPESSPPRLHGTCLFLQP